MVLDYGIIVEAIECCIEEPENCGKCPLYEFCGEGSNNLTRAVLDFIKSQNGKILELQEKLDKREIKFAGIVKENRRTLFNYIYSGAGFDEQIDKLLEGMNNEKI